MSIKNYFMMLYCAFLPLFSSTLLFSVQKTRDEMVKEYRNNLLQKLKPLNQEDRHIILRDVDQALASYSNSQLANKDYAEQIIATVIADYGKTKAELEARKHSSNQQLIQQFAQDQHALILGTLANNGSLNGLFDTKLSNAVESTFGKQQKPLYQQPPHVPSPWSPPASVQPAPSAPVAHPAPLNNYAHQQHLYYAHSTEDKERIIQATKDFPLIFNALINAKMTSSDQTRLERFFYQSVQKNRSIPATPPLPHLQNAFLALFNYKLMLTKNNLSHEIQMSSLEKAIKATQESLTPEIMRLTPQTANRLQEILTYLEDTVKTNAGISCSVCTQTYKEYDRFGSVEKVDLKSPYSGYPCHSVCKTCAKNNTFHSCPECRNSVDQTDLKQQCSRPDNPANWHP